MADIARDALETARNLAHKIEAYPDSPRVKRQAELIHKYIDLAVAIVYNTPNNPDE